MRAVPLAALMAGGGSAHREPGAGHSWRGTRRRVLLLAGGAGAALLSRVSPARAFEQLLTAVRVASDGHPYAGDRAALATIGGPGRRSARLHFMLNRRANVTLEVLQTGQGAVSERPVPVAAAALSENETMFGPGSHTLEWAPPANLPPRTYILRLTATSTGGRSQTEKTVVRLLGVDAAFAKRSVRPGDRVTLVTRTDARSLSAAVAAQRPRDRGDLRQRRDQGHPDGRAGRGRTGAGSASSPAPIALQIAPDWPSGVYFAQLTADDGRVGYAPLDRPSGQAAGARRGRAADDHLGRLQLPRRGRRRLGRHLVRTLEDEPRRSHAAESEPRCALPLPQLRPCASSTGSHRPARTSTCTPTRTSSLRGADVAARGLRPDRVPRVTPST